MNYQRVYDDFIADRRTRQDALTRHDRHHVVPRCLDGSDDPDNIVRLSHGDHLFAHVLLARIHGGVLLVAATRMCGMAKYRGRHSRERYRHLRERRSREMRGNRLGEATRGVPKSAEHRARIGAAHRGKKMLQAQKDRLREVRTGTTLSAEHRAKISASLIGNRRAADPTPERRAEIGRQSSERIAARRAAGIPHEPARKRTV